MLTGLRYWTALSQCRQAALLLIDKKQGPSDYKRGCNPQEKEKLAKRKAVQGRSRDLEGVELERNLKSVSLQATFEFGQLEQIIRLFQRDSVS